MIWDQTTIYLTRCEHDNHYNTDAVLYFIYVFMVMCMAYYVVH
jgi:hypothetical protein